MTIDPEPVDDVDDAPTNAPADTLARRHPATPITLTDLAAMKGAAQEIINARAAIVETLRVQSLRLTHPADHVLNRAPDGQVVSYLQDGGCDRVRDIWGIEVFGVGAPQKVAGNAPGEFHYLIIGSGRCKLTGQVLENVEGGRSSTDDFVKGKSGVELELLVRKAARANLDGNITRELAGLKAIPVDELTRAWTGTGKRVEDCHKGHGFGSRDERVGGRSATAPDVDPPVCPHCGATGVYRPAKGDRKAFYGCPQYGKHADKKFIVDAASWAAAHPAPTREPGVEG